jgi:hypothetical protein
MAWYIRNEDNHAQLFQEMGMSQNIQWTENPTEAMSFPDLAECEEYRQFHMGWSNTQPVEIV